MADKPTTAAGYRSEHVALVRATCLYVAHVEHRLTEGDHPGLLDDLQALPRPESQSLADLLRDHDP